MTETCELCGRGMARKHITPVWWPHDTVCRRTFCRQAARDSIRALDAAREKYIPLVQEIAKRHSEQAAGVGWRHDAFAQMEMDDEDFWATELAKQV